jgi:hypothetical protein
VDFRRLGNILAIGGVVVLIAAFAWWFAFYSSIMRELANAPGGRPEGNSVFDAISCLYSSTGVCTLISGVARLAGRSAYEPMVFWFGLAALVLGVVVRVSARPRGDNA